MTLTYTQKCLDLQKIYSDRLEAFDKQYPHCCKTCGGTGGVTYYERYDDHGGEWILDLCGCVSNGKCPLCGEQVWGDSDNIDEDTSRCNHCGWTYDSKIIRPPEFDYPCECYYEEEKKWEASLENWYYNLELDE